VVKSNRWDTWVNSILGYQGECDGDVDMDVDFRYGDGHVMDSYTQRTEATNRRGSVLLPPVQMFCHRDIPETRSNLLGFRTTLHTKSREKRVPMKRVPREKGETTSPSPFSVSIFVSLLPSTFSSSISVFVSLLPSTFSSSVSVFVSRLGLRREA
jgi:hypothetical protein